MILVTGAAGFIGTNLCKTFLEQGKKVIGVDNFITGTKRNIAFLQKFSSFSFLEMDIADPQLAKKLSAASIDAIYELACPTGVENLIKMPLEMLFASTIGVINLCEIAVEKKAPLFFASSSEVYGDPSITPQTEEYTGNVNPLGPRGSYEEGKRCAESIIAAYCRTRGLIATSARIFNVYGPHFSEKDTRAVPHFLTQIKHGRDLEIFGNGEQMRPFLYIDDFLNGVFLMMQKGRSSQAYNIGSDQPVSINDLARLLLQTSSSKSKIVYREKNPLDFQNKRLPSLKKINELG